MDDLYRSFRTTDIVAVARRDGIVVHRERAAGIADEFGWGERDGAGKRRFTADEASAIISVVRLRDRGFDDAEIRQLMAHGPDGIVDALTELINDTYNTLHQVA